MMNSKNIIFTVFLFLFAVNCLAVEATENEKKATGAWWINSSFATEPIPQKLLFHVEGTYSMEGRSGNMEGDAHRGNGMLAVRKKRFTTYLFLRKIYSDYVLKFSAMDQKIDEHDYQITFEYDLTRILYADFSFYQNKDSRILIDNRIAHFGGIGLHLDYKDIIETKTSLGLGLKKDEYSPVVPYQNETITGLYVLQMAKVNLGHSFTLHENLRLVSDVEDSQNYELGVFTQLRYQVTKFLGISYIFDIKHKNKVWPELKKTDIHHNFGVTLQFSN